MLWFSAPTRLNGTLEKQDLKETIWRRAHTKIVHVGFYTQHRKWEVNNDGRMDDERTPSQRVFSQYMHTFILVHSSHCGSRCRTTCLHETCSSTCHHMSERLLFPCFVFFLCLSCLYVLSHFYSLSVQTSTPTMLRTPRMKPKAHPPNEEYCLVAIYNPLTGDEPNHLDNFDYSEASAAIFKDESVDIDTELSYSCEPELDDELIGKALSSPLFIQEREEPANLRQTYHSHEESLLPAQSSFAHTRTVRPAHELSSCQKRKSSREMENERIRILLERQERAHSC